MTGEPTGTGDARVLFVCTANRGRSPIAEAILRRLLVERGVGNRVRVESAGMCAYELDMVGQPANPLSVAVAAEHRLDLSRHIVRAVTRSLVQESDLVVVMETWQAIALRSAFRDETTKVYTLRELAGESEDVDTPDIANQPPAAIESYLAEAERCLGAALRGGALAKLVAGATSASPAVGKLSRED